MAAQYQIAAPVQPENRTLTERQKIAPEGRRLEQVGDGAFVPPRASTGQLQPEGLRAGARAFQELLQRPVGKTGFPEKVAGLEDSKAGVAQELGADDVLETCP